MVVHGHTTMVNHGRPCFVNWPPMVDHGLINTMETMVDHGPGPWLTMVDYGQRPLLVDHGQRPWLTMVKDHGQRTKKVKFRLKRKSLLFHDMQCL